MNRPLLRGLLLWACLWPGVAPAANFLVRNAGSGADSNTADNVCSTATPANANTCTLRAAIQQGNALAGTHSVTFDPAVQTIVLSASLPQVTSRFTFDGSNPANGASGGRVVIDGGQVNGCFDLRETSTAVSPNGARGSTVKNFVIRRCQGAGISLSGHGYTITGNRIGTNPAGSAASGGADANTGDGISVSGTVTPPPAAPNIASLVADPPQTYGAIAAYSASLQTILAAVASPNLISGNVVSGNNGVGIVLFGQGTVNTIVAGNIVGLSADGLAAVPNGRGPGNRDGIRLEGTAWGNFIGPGNLVSGNSGSGIALQSGAVLLPNFVAGNLVGLGSAPTDVGNAENGITVDSRPNGNADPGLDNPTGFAAFIGPANTISDNRSDAGGADFDVVAADTSGGLLVTGASRGVEVFANVVGLATFPAGATPLGQLQYGNSGNGMVITVPGVRISRNLVLANGRHGILLRGAATTGTRILGNFIGVSVPTGLSPVVSLGNAGDGIHVFAAGASTIGGPAASDRNTIAANGRNGIALRQGSVTAGWANLIQRNAIYGNARGGSGIGIDLERVPNLPDGFNPNALPTNYANFDQLAPILCGGDPLPPECGGGSGPSFGGGGTALRWTLPLRPPLLSYPLRVEFFALPADGSGMSFLGEQQVTVDTLGRPTGAGCSNGICAATVGGSTDTSGQSIVATATDLLLADVPPTGDQPPQALSPSNNTSEFSTPVAAVRALEVATPAPLPPATTQTPYALAFQAVGGSGTYTNWNVAAGALPSGLVLAPATGVLSGSPTAAGTFNFAVRVTDSDGAQATGGYAITVTALPALAITTASPLPQATVGSAYSRTFGATGGSGGYTGWTVGIGSAPPGLSLASGTGVLAGTPTTPGTYEFIVQVSDSSDNLASRGYTLSVVPAPVPLAISTAPPLPAATEGADYSVDFDATGGSGVYAGWSVSAGMLPGGLVLDAATGVASGRPTAAGSFDFTVRVVDGAGASATRAYTLAVAAAPPSPPAPRYSVTPSRIDFGAVRVGTSATVPVVVRNISRTPFNPDIEISGDPILLLNSAFSANDGTCNTTLAVGASCTMNVIFRPRRGGGVSASGSARVSTPFIGSITTTLANLELVGVGDGRLVDLGPAGIDFGTQVTGTTTSVAISIANPTGSRLRVSGGALTSSAGFQGPISGCGATLDPGASCSIVYRFVPAVQGAFQSAARLRFEQDSGLLLPLFSDTFDILLAGIGTNVAQATSTRPVTLDFGPVQVGRSATLLVTTQNVSAANVSVGGGTFPSADVAWQRGPACAAPTAPGGTCLLDYSSLPREAIDYAINTALTVTQGAQSRQVALSLAGQGTGTLARIAPMRVDLGRVPVNGSSSAQVTISNTSEVTLAVSSSLATPFVRLVGCGASLAPGASCTLTYRLDGAPELVGFQTADARIRLENVAGGYLQQSVVTLTGEVVDAIFEDGFE
jgi:hypothetical protein